MSSETALPDRGDRSGRGDPEADGLWPEARRLAVRWCCRSLYRLRRGEGAFYEAEDLLQDLYIEFRATVDECRAASAGGPLDPPALWRAWSRRLWHGALNVLSRRPQALWSPREHSLDPAALGEDARAARLRPASRRFELDADDGTAGMADDASATADQAEALARVEAALWSLPPLCRQVVYLVLLCGHRAEEVARALALRDAQEVYVLLRRARRHLRRALAAEGSREREQVALREEPPCTHG